MKSSHFSALVLISSLLIGSAWASSPDQEIEAFLKAFQSNPQKAMNAIPEKKDAQGKTIKRSKFSTQEIQSRSFVLQKDALRKNFCTTLGGVKRCLRDELPGRAPFGRNDDFRNLIDLPQKALSTLEAIESANLTTAKLAESPWSDSYWPIYAGILGRRYADRSFPTSEDWKKNFDYVSQKDRTAGVIFDGGNLSQINQLSPSEKYDLLVGDKNFSLTQEMWNQGEYYYRSSGKVETWMGICHGWAAAAYMLPRAQKTLELLAADGKTKITFYPSDIKALGNLLWASGNSNSKFIGGRCNEKKPKTDTNGRVLDQKCFDTNPASWHLAVVNQIGVAKNSMVIDATYDYEVWNQPVYSYSYKYFNPNTGKTVKTLDEAKVAVSDFKNDKFAKYRSAETKYVVGIAMTLQYVLENEPTTAPTDSSASDNITSVRYLYDLELDANGALLGGEWYQNTHPDFVWSPYPGSKATTTGDRMIRSKWDGSSVLPADWQEAARASSSQGVPLSKIVDQLLQMTRVQTNRR